MSVKGPVKTAKRTKLVVKIKTRTKNDHLLKLTNSISRGSKNKLSEMINARQSNKSAQLMTFAVQSLTQRE